MFTFSTVTTGSIVGQSIQTMRTHRQDCMAREYGISVCCRCSVLTPCSVTVEGRSQAMHQMGLGPSMMP